MATTAFGRWSPRFSGPPLFRWTGNSVGCAADGVSADATGTFTVTIRDIGKRAPLRLGVWRGAVRESLLVSRAATAAH
jgi:hypothetical protein